MKSVESPEAIRCPHCQKTVTSEQAKQCSSCGGDWNPQADRKVQSRRLNQYQQQRILNWFILLLLLLFPAYTLLKGGFGIIPLLLFLPVIAWFFIGVRPFLKK